MLKKLLSGASAGIAICTGGAVFLSCDSRYVGAVMFSVALLCICMKGYYLFTGKVGYMLEKHDKAAFEALLIGLLGNALAAIIGGWLLGYAIPAIGERAETVCTSKLAQSLTSCFIRACFCGILMYLAVSIYRDNYTPAAIFFCVPVFILSGFEHSIADIFYFAASGIISVKAFVYLWLVVLGNSAGALLLPLMNLKRS